MLAVTPQACAIKMDYRTLAREYAERDVSDVGEYVRAELLRRYPSTSRGDTREEADFVSAMREHVEALEVESKAVIGNLEAWGDDYASIETQYKKAKDRVKRAERNARLQGSRACSKNGKNRVKQAERAAKSQSVSSQVSRVCSKRKRPSGDASDEVFCGKSKLQRVLRVLQWAKGEVGKLQRDNVNLKAEVDNLKQELKRARSCESGDDDVSMPMAFVPEQGFYDPNTGEWKEGC